MKKSRANKLALLVALLVLAGGQKLFAGITDTISSWLSPPDNPDLISNIVDKVPAWLVPTTIYSPYNVNFNGRDLVGKLYQDDTIEIDNFTFGRLYGDGDPNVLEIRIKQIGITKVSVDKVVKGISYWIKLSKGQYLEIAGTNSESGFTVPVYYVIQGPAKLGFQIKERVIDYLTTTTEEKALYALENFDFSADYFGIIPGEFPHYGEITIPLLNPANIFFDKATFTKNVAEKFVDEYVIPSMETYYWDMMTLYDWTKLDFSEYVAKGKDDAARAKRRGECPEYYGCPCKGDIAEHLIYSTAIKKGSVQALIDAIPFNLGTLIDVFTDSEQRKIKTTAILSTAIGYHYGWYPDKETFDSRFRKDAIVLFSGQGAKETGAWAIATAAYEEVMENCYEELATDLVPRLMKIWKGIPFFGDLLAGVKAGFLTSKEYREIGDNARGFFRVANILDWYRVPSEYNGGFGGILTGDSRNINGVAFGDDRFVAVGDYNIIAYSTDGIAWKPGTLDAATSSLRTVAYGMDAGGNGVFVAVGGRNNGTGVIAYSSNGEKWTAVENAPSGYWQGVAYGVGRWVVVGREGKTAFSKDGGKTWTAVDANGALGVLSAREDNTINAIAYGSDAYDPRFIIVTSGNRMAYSEDGERWLPLRYNQLGYCIGYDRGTWFGWGHDSIVYSSYGGIFWDSVDDRPFSDASFEGMAYGHGRWVIVDERGRTAYSDYGYDWRASNSALFAFRGFFSTGGFRVAYGNGKFVAVGPEGQMAFCDWGWGSNAPKEKGILDYIADLFGPPVFEPPPLLPPYEPPTPEPTPEPPTPTPQRDGNLSDWTLVTDNAFGSGDDYSFLSVAYGAGRFVAVGYNGSIGYSSDGINWRLSPDTRLSSPNGGSLRLTDIAYGNGKFVVVGDNGYLAYSSDGINWSTPERVKTSFVVAGGLAFGNGRFVVGDIYGKISYSDDGMTWTEATTASNDAGRAITYGNNRFVAVGSGGTIQYSSNGASWTSTSANSVWEYKVIPGSSSYTSSIYDVAYGAGKFVAVGENQQNTQMGYSTDGASWTAVNNPFGPEEVPVSIIYATNSSGSSMFVIGGHSIMGYSQDGVNWTAITVPIEYACDIAYGNGRFVAVGWSSRIAYCDW